MVRRLGISHAVEISADEARSQLQSEFARAAFDRLNRMQPQWRITDTTTLAPDIIIFDRTGQCRKTLEFGINAATLDDSVIEVEETLKNRVSKIGQTAIVLANDSDGNKRRFSYDHITGEAFPYAATLPPRRDGCCIENNCKPCLWGKNL